MTIIDGIDRKEFLMPEDVVSRIRGALSVGMPALAAHVFRNIASNINDPAFDDVMDALTNDELDILAAWADALDRGGTCSIQ